MDSAGELPAPESIGINGFVWFARFDPPSRQPRPGFPSRTIDPVVWLQDTLSYFNVQRFTTECNRVTRYLWKGRVRFTVPERRDSHSPLFLAARGIRAPSRSIGYKYGVAASLKLLARFGYKIPTYSSIIVQAMEHQGLFYDVEEYCLLMAQENMNSLLEDCDMTYAACSFEVTFDQVMRKLGLDWKFEYASPRLTTQGYQQKVVASRENSGGTPSFVVLSRPCRRPTKATKSVLCTALNYISVAYGDIDDLDYARVVHRHARLLDYA